MDRDLYSKIIAKIKSIGEKINAIAGKIFEDGTYTGVPVVFSSSPAYGKYFCSVYVPADCTNATVTAVSYISGSTTTALDVESLSIRKGKFFIEIGTTDENSAGKFGNVSFTLGGAE